MLNIAPHEWANFLHAAVIMEEFVYSVKSIPTVKETVLYNEK
jgi:hypothetical protein